MASKGFNINMPASAFRSFRYCSTSSRIFALILACRETTQWGSMKMMTGPSARAHTRITKPRKPHNRLDVLKSTPLCIQIGVSAICSCKARLALMVYGCTSLNPKFPWKSGLASHPQRFLGLTSRFASHFSCGVNEVVGQIMGWNSWNLGLTAQSSLARRANIIRPGAGSSRMNASTMKH